MQFLRKIANQEVYGHPIDDPLQTQKNCRKFFKIKNGVEISAPPESTFLGRVVKIFSGRTKETELVRRV